MAEAVRNPIFRLLSTYRRKIDLNLVDYVDLLFHKRLFSTMVEHTNAKISDDAQNVGGVEMLRFSGIMFAMTICPMNNIKEYWNVKNDGFMLASRFYEKLNLSLSRFQMIRQIWVIAPVLQDSKTFDGIRLLFDMFNQAAAAVFRELGSMSRHLDGMARTKSELTGLLR